MRRTLAILKYLPVVLWGLQVVAWVASLFATFNVRLRLALPIRNGPGIAVIDLYRGSVVYWCDLAGNGIGYLPPGVVTGGVDDYLTASQKYAHLGTKAGRSAALWHAGSRLLVEGGSTIAGGAIGYANGGSDGMLMGAALGQSTGSVLGNLLAACFRADSPIMTTASGGAKRADTIQKGDFLASRNEFAPEGPIELKRVEEVFVRVAPVVELVVRGKIIGTTAEHPFFVARQARFVPANELEVGDAFLSDDGQLVELEALRDTGEVETVYNFRIGDHHTYFVGGKEWGFSVWVHNTYQKKVMSEAEIDYRAARSRARFEATAQTITLRQVEGMSGREFTGKALALQELGEQGRLIRKSTPRDPKVTRAFRQDMIDRIWGQYGQRNREFANQLIDRVTRRMSPDHIHELQLLGPDVSSNLRWMDRFTNEQIGMRQIWPQIRSFPEGTPIRIRIE